MSFNKLCYQIKGAIENIQKTLLWEYDFEQYIINRKPYDPHLSKECKDILKTFYLFSNAKNYKKGDLWGNIDLDAGEKEDFFKSFLEVLSKYQLFNEISNNGNHYKKNLILMHCILPLYYVPDFLEIVKKIYEKDYDYKFYIQKINQNELLSYFTLRHFKSLIENKNTFIIFKDLIFRTAKTFELIENGNDENKYSLPNWYFEEIQKFIKTTCWQKKENNKLKFIEDKVVIPFVVEDSIYFFDENKNLMDFDSDANQIYLAENPKYIILQKDLTNWIEELEEYFSSPYYKKEVIGYNNYILYELIENIIDEEIDEYTFKAISQTNKISFHLKPLQNFQNYLSSLDGYEVYFDGFEIDSFNQFSSVYINNKEIKDKKIELFGKLHLSGSASLGKEVISKTVLVIPFKKIEIDEKNKKISVESKEYNFNDEIDIEGYKFRVNLPEIIIEESGKNIDVLLFRNLKQYSLKINNLPFKRAKIVYVNDSGMIVEKTIIKNSKKIYEIPEFQVDKKFPISIYIEAKNYKKLIGTIYKTEILDEEEAIEIYPKNKAFNILIQSKWDIFQKAKKYENHIISRNDFPEPKKGDFLVSIVDSLTNRSILEKTISNDTSNFKPKNTLIEFFQKVINVRLLQNHISHIKNIKKELKKINNVNYHLIDDDGRYKFDLYIKELDKYFKKAVDEYLVNISNNYEKIKYLLLFKRKFYLSLNFKANKISEKTLLMITNRFIQELEGLTLEYQLRTFKEIIERNSKENRKNILEILSLNEIQNIINQSYIRTFNASESS